MSSDIEASLNQGIINGTAISNLIREKLKSEVEKLDKKPFLATILVGDDPASQIYVSFKEKACDQVGFRKNIFRLAKDISQDELNNKIKQLNDDPEVNGILLQLPLPKHLDEKKSTYMISPKKDVDGLHYKNIGKLHSGLSGFVPCTPAGIIELLNYSNVDIEGKDAVVLGRSNLVGKPIARLLEMNNATVTVCHSRTQNLPDIVKRADIIIAAIGRPKFVTANMVKENAIVVDVGINRVDGKLVGDVDFDNVKKKVKLITPVPGGVGPMTITMLLSNTLQAYKNSNL